MSPKQWKLKKEKKQGWGGGVYKWMLQTNKASTSFNFFNIYELKLAPKQGEFKVSEGWN